MNILSQSMLYIHIAAGTLSLVFFWIPAFSKKGGNLHVKTGRFYVKAMWVVVVTAAILSIENFLQQDVLQATFLGYLSLLTANPLWHSIAILKNKKSQTVLFERMHGVLTSAVFICAILLLWYAFQIRDQGASSLLIIFGLIGLTSGIDLYKSLFGSTAANHWYRDHLSGMIVTGIAAYTAFLAFGGRALFSEILTGQWMIIPWILPTLLGTITISVLSRRHRRKLSSVDLGS